MRPKIFSHSLCLVHTTRLFDPLGVGHRAVHTTRTLLKDSGSFYERLSGGEQKPVGELTIGLKLCSVIRGFGCWPPYLLPAEAQCRSSLCYCCLLQTNSGQVLGAPVQLVAGRPPWCNSSAWVLTSPSLGWAGMGVDTPTERTLAVYCACRWERKKRRKTVWVHFLLERYIYPMITTLFNLSSYLLFLRRKVAFEECSIAQVGSRTDSGTSRSRWGTVAWRHTLKLPPLLWNSILSSYYKWAQAFTDTQREKAEKSHYYWTWFCCLEINRNCFKNYSVFFFYNYYFQFSHGCYASALLTSFGWGKE